MLAARAWHQAILQFQEAERCYAWHIRNTNSGPYLTLEAVPMRRRRGQAGSEACGPLDALVDFHVCYSPSYQVPIMYFRASAPDGAPLAFESIKALFPQWPQDPGHLLGFITQEEHPLLPGPPCYALHPCNTATVLALALGLDADLVQPAAPPQEKQEEQEKQQSAMGLGPGIESGPARAEPERDPIAFAVPVQPLMASPDQGLAPQAAASVACAASLRSGGVRRTAGAEDVPGAAMAPVEEPAAASIGACSDDTSGGVSEATAAVAARGGQKGEGESVPSGVGPGCSGSAVAAAAAQEEEEEDEEEDGGIPDIDQLLARMAETHLRGGGRPTWTPGLGTHVVLDGAPSSAPGAAAPPGLGSRPGTPAPEMVAGSWPAVGPAGVRWPGGEVPLCPEDPPWLRRYMLAWFSLVGPCVGLVEGRVRDDGRSEG